MLRALLACALLACALGKGVAPTLISQLKAQGDATVVSVACCGTSGGAVVRKALGAPASAVSVVEAATPIVLASLGDAGEAAAVLSASDVLAVEVSLSDLVSRSPHGLAQLAPLMRRAMRLRHLRPQKKLLLLAITDFESSEASAADVEAFVTAELEALAAEVGGGDGAPLASLLQLECVFVPYEKHEAAAHAASVGALGAALTSPDAAGYLFSDGQWSAPAAALASSLEQACAEEPLKPSQGAPPAEVHAAYQCGLLAEAAAREFNKGAAALRKTADAALLADFGEQAGALLEAALSQFDAASAAYEGSAPVSAARVALKQQLSRALYAPFRKQIAALQRKTLASFRQKLQALKPSSEIDAQLSNLVRETAAAFDAAAAGLLPPGIKWSCSYEKQAVVDNVKENAQLHLHTLQVQGLYLPTEGVKLPLDISAHWLGLHPFGRDSRYDPVGADDSPAFRPQAAPMSMRASNGYRPRTKRTDPKNMVFTDKMIQ